jgi:hypothetical protein
MKRIEDNIRKNRDLYDDAEPKAGHFERFSEKLDAAGLKKKTPAILRFSFIWRAAAVVLILITVSVLYNQIDNLSFIKASHSNELPTELIEAGNYYANLNREKIDKISELTSNDPDGKEVVNIALQEAESLDQNSAELKEKYLETKDDRVIDAIITNYRVLSALLDHIIERVNETR